MAHHHWPALIKGAVALYAAVYYVQTTGVQKVTQVLTHVYLVVSFTKQSAYI